MIQKKLLVPCKRIQDSLGFWILRLGFRIPGTESQPLSVRLGFWIPIVSGNPYSLSCNPDSTGKHFLDSRIRIPLHWAAFHLSFVTEIFVYQISVTRFSAEKVNNQVLDSRRLF